MTFNISYMVSFYYIVSVGFFIGLLLSLLKYLVAKLFSNEQMVMMSKLDIIDNAAITFLLFTLITLFFTSDKLFIFLSNNGLNIQTLWQSIIENISNLNSQLEALLDSSINAINGLSALNSISFSIANVPLSAYFLTNAIYNQAVKYTYIIYSLTSLTIALNVAIETMKYIQLATPYILSFGIMFRAFNPTRALGASLIGIALGSYFVFPISLYMLQSRETFTVNFVGISSDECGVVNINDMDSSQNPTTILQNLSIQSESIKSFVKTLYINMLLDYSISIGVSLMFIYYTALILSQGVVAYSLIGKLGSLL